MLPETEMSGADSAADGATTAAGLPWRPPNVDSGAAAVARRQLPLWCPKIHRRQADPTN